jgi:hypothetical protein
VLCTKVTSKDRSTGSRANFELAKQWLNRCLTEHEKCANPVQASPPLPTRVVDVDAGGDGSIVRLVSSAGHNGPYIILSHVWGGIRILTTTFATLDERLNKITMESLPRTFQNLVSIARQLSIRYVWIDSLCIIQDSVSDWSTESAKMGEYYMNSYFTVAAVSASDSSRGCFLERDLLKVTPFPMSIHLPESDSGVGRAGATLGFLRLTFGDDPSEKTDGFQRPPLWQRAWVVQERLLSTRLLQFSDVQMSWKCRSEKASERVPEGSTKYINGNNEDGTLKPLLLGLTEFTPYSIEGNEDNQIEKRTLVDPAGGTATESKDLYDAWYDLVMLYGKCDLTISSDIFPAISGIAKSISRASGDEFVAGLWKRDMHRGLLWTAPDSTASRRDLRQHRAPSWSWASLPATCSFYVRQIMQEEVDTSCMEIEETDVLIEGTNPFGIVSSGKLKIKGLLKRAHPYDADCHGEKALDEIREVQGGMDTLFDLEQGSGVGRYIPDNVDRRYLSEVWCSPIMTEVRKSRRGNEKQVQAHCLALMRIFEGSNVYLRVGVAWIMDFAWFRDCQVLSYYVI